MNFNSPQFLIFIIQSIPTAVFVAAFIFLHCYLEIQATRKLKPFSWTLNKVLTYSAYFFQKLAVLGTFNRFAVLKKALCSVFGHSQMSVSLIHNSLSNSPSMAHRGKQVFFLVAAFRVDLVYA